MLMLVISSALVLGSCGDDDNGGGGDKTALNALIVEADQMAQEATPIHYPQTAIDSYKATLQSIKNSAAGNRTQLEINNLVTDLSEAMTDFQSRAYGFIDESIHLAAGWHFDEGTGTTATAFSTVKHVAIFKNGHASIFAGEAMAPSWVEGVDQGSAIYLNNGAHLEVPYTATFLPASLSISVWIKPIELYDNNCILSQNFSNGYTLKTQAFGRPFFSYKKQDGGIVEADNETDNSIGVNVWSHLVITLNSSTNELIFYVNGIHSKTWTQADKEIGPLTQSLTAPDPQPFLIGTIATDQQVATWSPAETPLTLGYFKGAIDELKIYSTALTEGQVSKLYTDEKASTKAP